MKKFTVKDRNYFAIVKQETFFMVYVKNDFVEVFINSTRSKFENNYIGLFFDIILYTRTGCLNVKTLSAGLSTFIHTPYIIILITQYNYFQVDIWLNFFLDFFRVVKRF